MGGVVGRQGRWWRVGRNRGSPRSKGGSGAGRQRVHGTGRQGRSGPVLAWTRGSARSA
ncbi:MAG: hypothetical protein AVDCRST_MAG57-775 [uncultured Blastococcus sp.]|uniref:Uncharacterized protein n=1 Tax=uncultured Blastococcus sp. TaxID=217144 RepID=A0A6J4HII8_9ACTN|nr:MAG: hypothetical protein AVDCRST_MAG57-775 [uncultured Blastococcus sp.]